MPVISEQRIRLRLWLLLSAAFMALGAIAVILIAKVGLQRYEAENKAHLLSSAEVLSLSVDPANPESTRFEILKRADEYLPNVERVSILVPKGSGFEVAAQVSDGESTSQAIPSQTLALVRRSFERGEPYVEQSTKSSGPDSFQAIVPIRNQDRSIAAVLEVQQAGSRVAAREAGLSSGIALGILIVVLLSLIFGQIIASYLAPSLSTDAARAFLGNNRYFRDSLYELAVAALAAVVISVAVFGMLIHGDIETESSRSVSRIQTISELRSQILGVIADGLVATEEIPALVSAASRAEVRWPFTDREPNVNDLLDLSGRAEEEIKREALNFEKLRDSSASQNQGLLTVFSVAAFLSLGALVLIRTARRQERELDSARQNIARQQAAHKHISDNLPIGFYTYAKGQIETTNQAWDRLVGRADGESPWEVFEGRLHPDDKARVIQIFRQAEEDLNPFGIAYRLQMPDGSLRHVETRAVAVKTPDGQLEHLVGFLMDISSRVRAQRLLEDKNREVQASNDNLRKALAEIEDNFEAMVHSLVKAVEAKDPYTAGHSERVMAYSLKIGQRLGLGIEELRVLKMGTLVHDIGKIGVPDAILTKPSRLTDEEYELIKQHPMQGYKMIESIPTFSECLPIVLHHHERLDGRGYPFGLKGLEIPLLVRIAMVADCFDAMTSDRAYRKGLDPRVAIDELLKDVDKKIVDRNIVEVLDEIIREEGLTTEVNLSVA